MYNVEIIQGNCLRDKAKSTLFIEQKINKRLKMGRHFYLKTFKCKTVPCKLQKIAYRNENIKDAANNNKTSYLVDGNLFCLIEYNYPKR